MLLTLLFTLLLLCPAVVIAGFWRAARRRRPVRPGFMPDAEALVLARVGGILCAVLPSVQLLAGILRWRTGDAGLYLWYGVALGGLLLAVAAVTAFLTHARGAERRVSPGMVLLSLSVLLLITLLQVGGEA